MKEAMYGFIFFVISSIFNYCPVTWIFCGWTNVTKLVCNISHVRPRQNRPLISRLHLQIHFLGEFWLKLHWSLFLRLCSTKSYQRSTLSRTFMVHIKQICYLTTTWSIRFLQIPLTCGWTTLINGMLQTTQYNGEVSRTMGKCCRIHTRTI